MERRSANDVRRLARHVDGLPNVHSKLFKGGAEAYTELSTRRLREARAAGVEVGVNAVLNQASLDAGPERFYCYFVDELGLDDFQVNTPFPGGPLLKHFSLTPLRTAPVAIV